VRIARRVFAALADPAGVHAHRAGALERVALLLADWQHAHARLADTEARYAARYTHLTTREHNKLRPTQAQTVIAAAILRHLHAVITTGQRRDPLLATHGTRPVHPTMIAAQTHPASARVTNPEAGGRGTDPNRLTKTTHADVRAFASSVAVRSGSCWARWSGL
jgi:hypothetical protein